MNQTTLWDLPQPIPRRSSTTERHKRDLGMAMAAANNSELLELARQIALKWLRTHPTVSVEDVRLEIESHYSFRAGNWMGSIFKHGDFRPVGWTETTHEGGHGRMVRVWARA